MKNGKYRVLLVEDQTIPTQLFEHFIQTSERYELARSIECAAFAEVYCMTGEIDIVLMDVVTADGASGLDAAEKIKKNDPSIKIVIVTSMPECSYISRAKALGAEGFWYKETGKESLISVMDRVMRKLPTNWACHSTRSRNTFPICWTRRACVRAPNLRFARVKRGW